MDWIYPKGIAERFMKRSEIFLLKCLFLLFFLDSVYIKLVIPMSTAESLSSLFLELPEMCSRLTLPKTEVLIFLEKCSDGIKAVGSTKALGYAPKPSGASGTDSPAELGCTNSLDVNRDSHGRVGAAAVTVVKINLEHEDEIHS